MSRRALGALALSAGLLGGCYDGVSPSLHDLRFDGQAPDSPVVLLFSVDFEDPNGDLGHGLLETFINGRASGLGALGLEPTFLWNELPLDATEGTLELVLELSLAEPPSDGAEFELGVRALDSLGHVSAPATVRMRVEPQ